MFDGKPTLMMAALVGGLALFVAGFIIALEVRSTVASPAAAPQRRADEVRVWGRLQTSVLVALPRGLQHG